MVGFDSALEGLGRAQASFDRAAAHIARPISLAPENPQDQVSLSDEMVALITARNDYEANLHTIRTADQMQKTLLDVLGPWPMYIFTAAALILIVWALMTWPWERGQATPR